MGRQAHRGSGEHAVSRRVPSPVHSLVFVTGEPLQSWGPLSCVGGHWSPHTHLPFGVCSKLEQLRKLPPRHTPPHPHPEDMGPPPGLRGARGVRESLPWKKRAEQVTRTGLGPGPAGAPLFPPASAASQTEGVLPCKKRLLLFCRPA